jgi:hypothetical protein
MSKPEPEPALPPVPVGFRIRDLVGLVVGYGLAGFLLRSFRPVFETQGTGEAVALVGFYLWLGLAVSGPFVLALNRRGPAPSPRVPTSHPPSRYAAEEMAWLGIGGYFVAIALFVVPSTQHRTPWEAILAVQAFVAFWVGPWWARRRARRKPGPEPVSPRWTRAAARVVLFTWPLAWVLLVLLVR